MNHINVSKTCPNCLRKTKVFLVDLNLYNGRGGRIKFKQCKRKIKKDSCVTLILDKISINMKNLNGNLGRC